MKTYPSKGLFEQGLKHLRGDGRRIDPFKALDLFRVCAGDGHADAQLYLGKMLRNGHGPQQDFSEAAKWLRRAACQGDMDAQFEIGTMYRLGEGVGKNRVVALKWLLLAAWDGDSDAELQGALAACELTEEQQERAIAKALMWEPKALARS